MLKNFTAVVAGVLGGVFLVGLITQASHKLYGTAQHINPEDTEGMEAFITALPIGAFILIIVAHASGALTAGGISSRLAQSSKYYLGLVAVFFILLAVVITGLTIPGQPSWMLPADLICTTTLGVLGAKIGSR